MPQEVVRPASGLSCGIHIGPAEEKSLHDKVLQLEFARLDLLMNPLMTRIETTCVAAHGSQPCLFLNRKNPLGVGKRVCDRYLDLDVFAGAHAFDGLFGVYLRWRGENHGVKAWAREGFVEIRRPVRNAVFFGGGFGRLRGSAVDADDFGIFNPLKSIQVFFRERTLANHANPHEIPPDEKQYVNTTVVIEFSPSSVEICELKGELSNDWEKGTCNLGDGDPPYPELVRVGGWSTQEPAAATTTAATTAAGAGSGTAADRSAGEEQR